MAGQGGDEGSSKQAALKGKDPVSPSGENISIDDPEEIHEVAAEDEKDKGKKVMTDEENSALAAKEDAEEKASADLMNQVRDLVATLPTTHPGVEDTGTGKRAGDQSGTSEAKKPRKAGGSPTRRGKTGGFVANPALGGLGLVAVAGVGPDNPPLGGLFIANPPLIGGVGAGVAPDDLLSIIDEPRFLKNAMSSAMDKGFLPLQGPPNVYLPQTGVLCYKCRAADATTNFYATTDPEHLCLCVPCVYLVATDEPTQVPCGICQQDAIDIFYNKD